MTKLEAKSFHLAPYGKWKIAESMYLKGKSFIAAAYLLHERGAYEYVVVHLVCQGTEIVLKALLLFRDYDYYSPRIPSPSRTRGIPKGEMFGHDLKKIATEVARVFRQKAVSEPLAAELDRLNRLYSANMLRYGHFRDILVDPKTIEYTLTLRKLMAVMRLADRHVWKTSR